MKHAKTLVLGFSLLAFAGASAYAQQAQQERPQQQRTQQKAQVHKQDQLRTSDLIGKKVNDRQGKRIGEIEDVILNLDQGRVQAVVLSFGGILGMGEKNYAFPMSELKAGKKRGEYQVDVDKQKLENAEGFAKNEWPSLDDEYWTRIGQSGATAGATQPKAKATLVRASKLKGEDVEDRNGKNVAEVQDVIVGMDGKVRNIVLDVEDAGHANVQANALTRAGEDKLVLNMDPQQLKQRAQRKSGGSNGAQSSNR